MIRFHREGANILLYSSALTLALSIVSIYFLEPMPYLIIQAALLAIIILLFRFFRNPKRVFSSIKDTVFAPADGTIVAIEPIEESEYFHDERIQVSIFMSIHNVHINWYPFQGMIKYYKYHPGKYLLARHPKSSVLNEHTTVVVGDDKQDVLVRQIAGFVARRIVCYAVEGETVNPEKELGFIKFGSRLDLILPKDAKINVNLGDKTKGGITKIATLSE